MSNQNIFLLENGDLRGTKLSYFFDGFLCEFAQLFLTFILALKIFLSFIFFLCHSKKNDNFFNILISSQKKLMTKKNSEEISGNLFFFFKGICKELKTFRKFSRIFSRNFRKILSFFSNFFFH